MPQDSFEVSQTSLEVKELQLEFGEFGKFVKNIMGLLSSCGARASCCGGFSYCGTWA